MPRLCAALLALTAAALTVLVLAPTTIAGGSSPASGSAYPWVQPWSVAVAPDVGRWAQPPASVPIVMPATQPGAPPLLSSYPWVQPWELARGVVPDVGRWTQPPPVPSG